MGPYVYKSVLVTGGIFFSAEAAVLKIQVAIDDHVAEGWELFEYRPVQLALIWKWTVLIFRKPSP